MWVVGVKDGFHARLMRSGDHNLVRAVGSQALLALDET